MTTRIIGGGNYHLMSGMPTTSHVPSNAKLICGTKTWTDNNAAALEATVVNTANGVLVQADPDNLNDMLVGNSSSQPIQLIAGQTIFIEIADVSRIYGKPAGASTAGTLNYMARR